MVPRHLQELFTVCLAHRIQARTGHAPKAVARRSSRRCARRSGRSSSRADPRAVDPEMLEGLSADLPGVSRLERRFADG